jgi:hypothetical protein
MKLIWSLLLLFTISNCAVIESYAQPVKCPNINDLKLTSLKNKKEVIDALQKIVPQTYNGKLAKFYTEWRVITATPFPLTVGNEINEGYYGMAKHFCGNAVADRSWLVRLYFPKWEGKSASALEGQLYLAKSKEKGWFVWFRYH